MLLRLLKWPLRLVAIAVVLLLMLLAFGWFNSDIQPVVLTPDPNPGLTGEFAVNNRFDKATYLSQGLSKGPEAIAFNAEGELFTGLEDGRIVVLDLQSKTSRLLSNTGGRPLGMKFDASGNLIVADAYMGLLSITADGALTTLVGPDQLTFADDLAIATDGTIWLSDASGVYGYDQTIMTFIEGIPSGRLLSYSPATGELTTHIDKLLFANGVALGPNDDYVLVNETATSRIHRLWLKGDKAGQVDLFASELPAVIDNITFNGRDTYWLALPGIRNDGLAHATTLRKIVGGLPIEKMLPKNHFGFILGLNMEGEVTHNYQFDPSVGQAKFSDVTSVIEHNGKLFVGSISEAKIAILELPKNPPQ